MPRGKEHTCIDLFAGAGGLSLGLEMAGFRPLLCCEVNDSARETYFANRQGQDIVEAADIYSLKDSELKRHMKKWGGEVDLVCGGPPCQGYSGIGIRRTFTELQKQEVPGNHLYQQMIRVIKCVKPKAFLFENVRGLLTSRWTSDSRKGSIFRSVLNELDGIKNYEVEWQLIKAKDYGVPQNRPRVFVVGIRKDVLEASRINYDKKSKKVDKNGLPPFKGRAVEVGFLPPPSKKKPPSIKDLLSDLVDPRYGRSQEHLEETTKYPRDATTEIQKWFRNKRGMKKKGFRLKEQEYSKHCPQVVEKFQHMIDNDGEIPTAMQTKKFAQRVLPRGEWGEDGPTITATSLPDDYVHYRQPRIPTVREWARIQTFPDWYEFRGKRTTGGRRRAGDPGKGEWEREVPKYTQIGNSVPVLLAKSIGEHLRSFV